MTCDERSTALRRNFFLSLGTDAHSTSGAPVNIDALEPFCNADAAVAGFHKQIQDLRITRAYRPCSADCWRIPRAPWESCCRRSTTCRSCCGPRPSASALREPPVRESEFVRFLHPITHAREAEGRTAFARMTENSRDDRELPW